MSGENKLSQSIINRIAELHAVAPGSIGDIMEYRLTAWDDDRGEYIFTCKTFDWMRNGPGTLHGGLCVLLLLFSVFFSSAIRSFHNVRRRAVESRLPDE